MDPAQSLSVLEELQAADARNYRGLATKKPSTNGGSVVMGTLNGPTNSRTKDAYIISKLECPRNRCWLIDLIVFMIVRLPHIFLQIDMFFSIHMYCGK